MIEFYFAYGSNMNPARMRARGIPVRDIASGCLTGFELCFDKRALGKPGVAHANIRVCREAAVEGVLYTLAEPTTIARLDVFEGAPVRYSREVYPIETASGTVHAWVYVGNRAMLGADLLPEQNYLAHLLAGRCWYSQGYFMRLSAQPCFEPVIEPGPDRQSRSGSERVGTEKPS